MRLQRHSHNRPNPRQGFRGARTSPCWSGSRDQTRERVEVPGRGRRGGLHVNMTYTSAMPSTYLDDNAATAWYSHERAPEHNACWHTNSNPSMQELTRRTLSAPKPRRRPRSSGPQTPEAISIRRPKAVTYAHLHTLHRIHPAPYRWMNLIRARPESRHASRFWGSKSCASRIRVPKYQCLTP